MGWDVSGRMSTWRVAVRSKKQEKVCTFFAKREKKRASACFTVKLSKRWDYLDPWDLRGVSDKKGKGEGT